MKMVRMGDWKLLFDMMGNGQLYNVARDPYELKNLYGRPEAKDIQPADGRTAALDHSHAGRSARRGLPAQVGGPQLVYEALRRITLL